jgi:hypothetical protein
LEHFDSSLDSRFSAQLRVRVPPEKKEKGRWTFARGPSEIGFAMNYKAGAQAGASTCQRHHPAQSLRLAKSIVCLVIHTARPVVNRCSAEAAYD